MSRAANQEKTEPVPPTQAHDTPRSASRKARPDAGAGTATGAGPREGGPGVPSIARDRLADGEPDTRAPGTTTF
jgi:hypothetical protein